MNENFNYNQSNNSKKIPIIICVIAVICVLVFVYFKFIKTDSKSENNNNSNSTSIKSVEENTSSNINTNNSNINTNSNTYNETVSSDTNVTYDENGTFLMAIEDVFTITGRGTVVTGRIERGTINLNDTVQIIGLNDEIKTTTVTGIEMFRQTLDTAKAGDNVGLLLRGIERSEVERGQVLAKPNSIKNGTKFDAQVYVLTKEEGGRRTPFFNGYRPQFYFRTTDITGVVELPANTEMVYPGNTVNMTIELISPVAMEAGTEFSIIEGGRTVGKGTVTKIY